MPFHGYYFFHLARSKTLLAETFRKGSVPTRARARRDARKAMAIRLVNNQPESEATAGGTLDSIGLPRRRQRPQALVMVDLNVAWEPNPAVLQRVFDLTPSEASLAVKISWGESPMTIARSNGVAISTVRSQLAAVFAKTNTQRQAELVALLARVSLLPESFKCTSQPPARIGASGPEVFHGYQLVNPAVPE
jgi:DNA-binding CsgD family transcriptional regulator